MQQQYWLRKKAVQRRLGSKEDECIVSSDAELDSKLQIFKAINTTNTKLAKIINTYNERLYFLSQEENDFGRFMCEAGKRSRMTSRCITRFGKTIQFCGQQMMCIRVPLLRLHHEVTIFKECAVSDTQNTINSMERERTEYRAALEWMKSLCESLDPDTGRGIHKYRTVQNHVRLTKNVFDSIAMDCIQKIDLLSAARCNMFSHALVSYIGELKQNGEKTVEALDIIIKHDEKEKKRNNYDFCVLKDLQEIIESEPTTNSKAKNVTAANQIETKQTEDNEPALITFTDESTDQEAKQSDKIIIQPTLPVPIAATTASILSDLNSLTLATEEQQIAANESSDLLGGNILDSSPPTKNLMLSQPLWIQQLQPQQQPLQPQLSKLPEAAKQQSEDFKTKYNWLQLFSELDPLTNLEQFNKTIHGMDSASQHT